MCVCVVSVNVRHPILPPRTVDGHSKNPLYHYLVSGTYNYVNFVMSFL